MTRISAIFLVTIFTANMRGDVVDLAPQRGNPVAPISWTDENGRDRQISELAGYPVILLPIYTRCRTACLRNVDQLKKTIANSTANPQQFRVLLFSFDATDSPATLSKYRREQKLPLAWSLGRASQPDIDALLEAIGSAVGKAGTEFTHPNVLIFLDPNLRIAKWIYGTDYTANDVDFALQVASGQNDWLSRYSEWLYALLLFGGSILCVALCHHVAQLNQIRRSARRATPI
jgi:protein SCO1/2